MSDTTAVIEVPPVTNGNGQNNVMGLGKFSGWANLTAVAVVLIMFYSYQQNSFEMYKADKIASREDLRIQWEAIKAMQQAQHQDMQTMSESVKDLTNAVQDMQKVSKGMLEQIKELKENKDGKVP